MHIADFNEHARDQVLGISRRHRIGASITAQIGAVIEASMSAQEGFGEPRL